MEWSCIAFVKMQVPYKRREESEFQMTAKEVFSFVQIGYTQYCQF